MSEITRDIDAVRDILDDLNGLSHSMGSGGELTQEVLNGVLTRPGYNSCYRHVAVWRFFGQGTVFIQDANSLVLPTRELVSALTYLKEKIPGIQRVTSYARSSTVARKSLGELSEIRQAGLDRIHIGLESGSDRVLALVKKGATARQHIEAGCKAIEAGMTLSEYIMPGLGGAAYSREHALETARVLNAIDPHYIRLRSLRVPPHTPLHQDLAGGRFQLLSDDEVVQEIRLLVESLNDIQSTLSSDHIMNLLQEVEGTFPRDKQKMLAVIDRYLSLPEEERLLYRLGRRGGALQSLDDLNDPRTRSRLDRARRDLAAENAGDLERIITELGDQYI